MGPKLVLCCLTTSWPKKSENTWASTGNVGLDILLWLYFICFKCNSSWRKGFVFICFISFTFHFSFLLVFKNYVFPFLPASLKTICWEIFKYFIFLASNIMLVVTFRSTFRTQQNTSTHSTDIFWGPTCAQHWIRCWAYKVKQYQT